MISSRPSRVNVAGASLTLTDVTVSPRRSRLKRQRFWVAAAVIVALPSSRCVVGLYFRFEVVVGDVVAAVADARVVRVAEVRGAVDARRRRRGVRCELRRYRHVVGPAASPEAGQRHPSDGGNRRHDHQHEAISQTGSHTFPLTP